MLLNTLATLLLLFCIRIAEGLRVTNMEVPRYIMVGDSATLKCHFKLEGETLYSVNWWKDDRQFYQYIPKNQPKKVIYNISGVTVNEQNSGVFSVELTKTEKQTKGEYRCEVVGEAPTFHTKIRRANLTIIDPPDGPPVIRGQKQLYHPGEIIRLNCTTYWSRPATQLMWVVREDRREPSLSSSASSRPMSFSYVKSSSSRSSSSSLQRFLPKFWSSFRPPFLKKSSPPTSIYRLRVVRHISKAVTGSEVDDPSSLKPLQTDPSSLNPPRKDQPPLERAAFEHAPASNYTQVDAQYLITYPLQSLTEEGMPPVASVLLGIQFPAGLVRANEGRLSLRCIANISKYTWATEVTIEIAKVPVADPQQLPTLHDTGSTRGLACNNHKHHSEIFLVITFFEIFYII